MIDLHTFVGGWIAGLVTGASLMRWRIRCRISHENINRTLALQPLGRIGVGYQPRSQGGAPNPPPREP